MSVCDHDHLDLKAGDRGFVHSPSYPAKYNSGATCRLTMEAPHGTDVILTLLHANFPDGNTCSHDSLVIAGDETTPDQICADMALPKHYDFGNVTITFKIDRMQNFAADHPALAKGFILQYEGEQSRNDFFLSSLFSRSLLQFTMQFIRESIHFSQVSLHVRCRMINTCVTMTYHKYEPTLRSQRMCHGRTRPS